jgi:hypothetical protein
MQKEAYFPTSLKDSLFRDAQRSLQRPPLLCRMLLAVPKSCKRASLFVFSLATHNSNEDILLQSTSNFTMNILKQFTLYFNITRTNLKVHQGMVCLRRWECFLS